MNRSMIHIAMLLIGLFVPSTFADGAQDLRAAIGSLDQGIAMLEENDPEAIPAIQDAAAQIQAAIDEHGFHSVAAYHALGNAYTLSGDHGHAMLAYRRAQLIDPRDARVRDSIDYTREQLQVSIEPTVSNRVRAALLSWRGFVPRAWFWYAFIGLFVMSWVIFAFGFNSNRTRRTRTLGVATLVLALFPVSSLGYEWAYEHTRDAVIIVHDQVLAMSGPDDAIYDQVFDQPLSAGVEAVLTETRNGWGNLRLSNGSTCWVPRESFVAIVPNLSTEQTEQD